MRKRTQIVSDEARKDILLLEVLLDIRDLIKNQNREKGKISRGENSQQRRLQTDGDK